MPFLNRWQRRHGQVGPFAPFPIGILSHLPSERERFPRGSLGLSSHSSRVSFQQICSDLCRCCCSKCSALTIHISERSVTSLQKLPSRTATSSEAGSRRGCSARSDRQHKSTASQLCLKWLCFALESSRLVPLEAWSARCLARARQRWSRCRSRRRSTRSVRERCRPSASGLVQLPAARRSPLGLRRGLPGTDIDSVSLRNRVRGGGQAS